MRSTLPWIALMLMGNAAGPASPAGVRSELRPLQFLVGHCWTGKFPDGKTDTHCFESVFDGRFVRDRHVVRGGSPYAGETLYAWDARRKMIVYTYWASDGGLSTGAAAADASGNLTFSEDYAGAEAARDIRNVWSRRDERSFEIQVSEKKDGASKELWRMVMTRDASR